MRSAQSQATHLECTAYYGNHQYPGKYTVIATFAGSDSYYRSYSETAFGVTEASTVAQAIEPEPAAPAAAFAPTEPSPAEPTQAAEAPLVTTEVALIAVVAVACVIGIVAFFALRKRK